MSTLIHPDVIAGFRDFSARFEGVIDHLYLDVEGLPTTGIGFLVSSVEASLLLPWVTAEGDIASDDAIRADYERVKAMPKAMLAHRYANAGALRLTNEAVDALLLERLEANAEILAAFFPGFADFPAPAQWALLSMAWACGAGNVKPGVTSAEWPRLQAAVRARDWLAAAEECAITTAGNAGIAPRNTSDRALFLEAAVSDS